MFWIFYYHHIIIFLEYLQSGWWDHNVLPASFERVPISLMGFFPLSSFSISSSCLCHHNLRNLTPWLISTLYEYLGILKNLVESLKLARNPSKPRVEFVLLFDICEISYMEIGTLVTNKDLGSSCFES